MIGNMLANKTGDEVIAMIVAFVEAYIERLICHATGFDQIFGTQLCRQKLIFQALINAHTLHFIALLNKRAGIILLPFFTIFPSIGRKDFFSPRHKAWRQNGRKGRNALITFPISQCQYQCTVSTH